MVIGTHLDIDAGKPPGSFSFLLDRRQAFNNMGGSTQIGSDCLFSPMALSEYGGYPQALRPEDGGGGGRGHSNMVESFASLYNDNHGQQQQAQLSATALLQKAAQMGAASGTGPSIFAGIRMGPAASSSSSELRRDGSNLNALLDSSMAAAGINESCTTRDFLGVGRAVGNNLRSYLRQDMTGFMAGLTSNPSMDVGSYHVSH